MLKTTFNKLEAVYGKNYVDALKNIISALSFKLSVSEKEIFMASTGVIGEPLDYKKIIGKVLQTLKCF